MIHEVLIVLYALGVVLSGAAIGFSEEEEIEKTGAPFGVFVMLCFIPGMNLIFGASGVAEFIRKRSA
jgi:hypothetical protein